MEVGQTFTQTLTVQEKDSARSLGSGGLDVFGTPAMIALMEKTALLMVRSSLEAGTDTVGIEINAKHIKASPIGAKITCTATISAIDGRKISYTLEAKDGHGETIGTATHDRFIVDMERFMSKLK
ncbi:MAG: thioesterase family protein [Paludibacteraceae bacterium]|nr:thioesterase family protein [Paludibacteraceae bacterium]